jgi:hypothetical protein
MKAPLSDIDTESAAGAEDAAEVAGSGADWANPTGLVKHANRAIYHEKPGDNLNNNFIE